VRWPDGLARPVALVPRWGQQDYSCNGQELPFLAAFLALRLSAAFVPKNREAFFWGWRYKVA